MLHSTGMRQFVFSSASLSLPFTHTSYLSLSFHPLQRLFLFIRLPFITMSVSNIFSSTWADCGETEFIGGESQNTHRSWGHVFPIFSFSQSFCSLLPICSDLCPRVGGKLISIHNLQPKHIKVFSFSYSNTVYFSEQLSFGMLGRLIPPLSSIPSSDKVQK